MDNIEQRVAELKALFKPGQFLVHKRKASCLGTRLPLVIFAKIKKVEVNFRSGSDSEEPGRFHLKLKLALLTMSHGMSAIVPVTQFERGLLEYDDRRRMGMSVGVFLTGVNEGLAFSLLGNDHLINHSESSFDFQFTTAKEVKDFQYRLNSMVRLLDKKSK